jgi:hypothetical protein
MEDEKTGQKTIEQVSNANNNEKHFPSIFQEQKTREGIDTENDRYH